MKYTVRDGARVLNLEGEILAESSSRTYNRPRWVEFTLYKGPRGQYVVYRVGRSVYFHSSTCDTVSRNRLSAVSEDEITNDHIPCPDCKPSRISVDGLFPETPRYKTWVTDSAEGMIKSLYKYDDNGTEYLTNVVVRLLEDAAESDSEVADAYFVSNIE